MWGAGSTRRRLPPAPVVLAAVAAAVYLNALPAQFTFDDSFAVVYNGDVTDLNKPLLALFRNDFWGQDIRSPMSHKSYRPLTTLSFRAQHWASWGLRRGQDGGKTQQAQETGQQALGRRGMEGRTARPFVFHLTNVATHALVTVLVYRLARQLAASRRLLSTRAPPEALVASTEAASAAAAAPETGSPLAGDKSGSGGSSGDGSGSGSRSGNGSGARTYANLATEMEPFLAGLLFALHPVHTEAVAGVVGHAELLCAALSIPALLSYLAAADGRAAGAVAHWRHVATAVLLGWAAALTKEIGITIMGAMLCYDALVAPLGQVQLQSPAPSQAIIAAADSEPQPAQPPPEQQLIPPKKQRRSLTQHDGSRSPARHALLPTARRAVGRAGMPAAAAVAAAATEFLQQAAGRKGRGFTTSGSAKSEAQAVGHGSGGAGAISRASRLALRLKLLRMATAVAAVVLYVKARSWLAGDQLVRIYRKVENPIPFADSSLTRKLTAGYLHARYAGLLLLPLQLSADWSYACIEYVSSLWDPRNLATAAIYGALLAVVLTAKPWQIPLEWAGRLSSPSQALHERRWRLAVVAGLVVGPFFPASNVLFYVGTFIGERLLYFPSVGYCILLAHPLAAALEPVPQHCTPWFTSGASCGASKSKGAIDGASGGAQPRRRDVIAAAASVALAVLLCFYTAKTMARNRDWLDEERLFIAAQKVCWRSGKVQLNSGIIARRYERWEDAEAHFKLAQAVDPEGFCEPQYHIALTLLPRNLTGAIEYLERGVGCKYTAADSLQALNQIYQQLLQRSPEQSAAMLEKWATVLARPEVQRFTEAATYFESAAAKAQSPLQAVVTLNRAQALLQEAHPVDVGRTPDRPVRVPASRRQLDTLLRCLEARRYVILALLAAGGDARAAAVKRATYSYLQGHGEECRRPMPVPEDAYPEDRAARSITFHTGLMHMLQEGDVNDPWLQQEWGLLVVAGGRTQEALAHLEVAGHIFAAQLQPAGEAAVGADAGARQAAVLDAQGGGSISPTGAAEAAVAAYRHAKAAVEALSVAASQKLAAVGGKLDPATRLRMLCHLQQLECGVYGRLQQAAAAAGHRPPGAQQVQHAAATATTARLRGCVAEGLALGCPAGSFHAAASATTATEVAAKGTKVATMAGEQAPTEARDEL